MVIRPFEAGRLAQLVEHLVYTERVGGSSPSSPTNPNPAVIDLGIGPYRGLLDTPWGEGLGVPALVEATGA